MLINIISSNGGAAEKVIMLVAYVVAIAVSFSCHEFAHAFAAFRAGDPSAKIAGRLSVNPLRHVDPMGLFWFCVAGIGWAKPVPVNPFNYRNFRKGNFWVSIAGILANLAIGFVCSFFLYLTVKFGDNRHLAMFGLEWLFRFAMLINISLMVFNLLPVYPLDGYNMLVSFTKPNNSFMMFMRRNSMFILPIVLVVLLVTGGLSAVCGGIEWCFNSLWGLMF